MNVTDCGQCRTHADCTVEFAVTCFHTKSGDKPANFCAGKCKKSDEPKQNAICLYDENAGTEIWKCKHGYQGVACQEEMGCQDKCLNDPKGCEGNKCVCNDWFTGDYCQTPSECHPGKSNSDFLAKKILKKGF